MSSKSSLARSASSPEATPDIATLAPSPVKLTTDLTQVDAMPSPALDLQENLRQVWSAAPSDTSRAADERKIPLGWALAGVAVGCGVFWALLAAVIF